MLAKVVNEVGSKYYCDLCNYETQRSDYYKKHLLTVKHRSVANVAKKETIKFYCEYCDYGTCRKSSYTKHNSTEKHKVAKLAKGGTENDEKNLKSFIKDILEQSKEYVKRIEDLETKTAHIISQNKVQT
jgi:hypothetical protein